MHDASSNPSFRHGRPDAARLVWNWRDRGVDPGADPRPSAAALRREGLVRAMVGLSVGTVLFIWWHPVVGMVALTIAGITLIAALVSPGRLYLALHRAIERLGRGIGALLGWVLLPLFFFLVMTPLALLMRIGNPDRLHQRRDPKATSYWVSRREQPARDRAFYERQF